MSPAPSATDPGAGSAHPLAKRMWSLVRDRGAADKRLVYEALRTRLAPTQGTANQEIAIAALVRFAAAQAGITAATCEGTPPPAWANGPPSRRRYESFRASQPRPRDWPSANLIVTAFDYQWASALLGAGLAFAPDVLARRRTTRPASFTTAELQDIVRTWIAAVDTEDPGAELVQGDFFVWLEQQRRDPDSALDRWPSRPTVRRHLGPWSECLQALGVAHRHPAVGRGPQLDPGDPKWQRAQAAVSGLDLSCIEDRDRTSGRAYSVPEILDWLRRLTQPLPADEAANLTMDEWDLLRRALRARLLEEAQRLVDIPCAARIVGGPGIPSWPQAKVMAGIAEAEPAITRTRNEPYTDAELEAALIAAANALGSLPSRSQYACFRRETLARRRSQDPWAHMPVEGTLRLRLGKSGMHWHEVLETVLDRHPQLARYGADDFKNAETRKPLRAAKAGDG